MLLDGKLSLQQISFAALTLLLCREYFASRAAAQAVKAKVESYERGGAASHNSGHARRYSDGSDSSSAPPTDLSRLDPETRIAVIKAQKEKDRERELAAKERQLQEAYETNRQERKRFEGMKEQAQHQKGAIAFEIDVGSEATRIDPEVRLSMMKAQKEKEKEQELANKEKQLKEAYQESRQERRKLKEQAQQNQGAMAFDIDLNGDVKVLDSKSRNSDGGKPKKGWGPPVPTSNLQLAHGVRSAALGCAQPPGRNDVRQEEVKSVSIDEDDMKSGYSEFDGLGETEVMKKLQSKRASQLEARAQVKDVFRKLREKKKKEAEKKAAG